MTDDLKHFRATRNESAMALLEVVLGVGAGLFLVYAVALIVLHFAR